MRPRSPLSGHGSSSDRHASSLAPPPGVASRPWHLVALRRRPHPRRTPPAPSDLRERHHFHARHRTAFLWAASLLVVLLAWFVLTRMRPEALRDDSWIGVFALLYLFAVHRRTNRTHALPKELAVAILFAAATAVPAWSRLGASNRRKSSWRPPSSSLPCFAGSIV